MEDYIKQMQEYLNKNTSKNEENKNILENLEKNTGIQEDQEEESKANMGRDQLLFDCFQQIMNNSDNDKNDNGGSKKIENEKDARNYEDISLPTMKNKINNFQKKEIANKNNIDDIPIKGIQNLNFNELLEKELSKEKNEGNFNNTNNIPTKPKFKYIPKKKVDLVSAPVNTKKYKYYSDNFKPKNRRHSANISKKVNNNKNNDEEIHNNSDDFDKYNNINNNQAKKKRIAPIMPDDFKNSKFNRGKGYIGPLKEGNQENKNENNNLNINENNIKSLWGEFQNNYEQKDEDDLEDFHDNEEDDDEIKMNPNIDNIFVKNVNKNIVNNDYNNFNYFNNEEYKEEIPFQQKVSIQEKFKEKEKE